MCLVLPIEVLGAAVSGLSLLAVTAGACAIGAGFGMVHVQRAPGEASLVLAVVLTTGSLASAMVLGVPGMESYLTVSLAALGYGSGVFLAVAAWFAAYSLRGAPPAVEMFRDRQRRSLPIVRPRRGARRDSQAA